MRKHILSIALAAMIAAVGSATASAAAPEAARTESLSAVVNSILSDRRYGSELERMMAVNDAVMEYMMNQSAAFQGRQFYRPPHGVFVSREFFDMAERMDRMMQVAGFAWPYADQGWMFRAWPEPSMGQVGVPAPSIDVPAEETDI